MNYKFAFVSSHIPKTLPIDALRMEDNGTVNLEHAQEEHNNYIAALKDIGLNVIPLNIKDSDPDSVFVEDTMVIRDNKVLITRPGTHNRRKETITTLYNLLDYIEQEDKKLSLHIMTAPNSLEGGDVLFTGSEFFVGISPRTNEGGFNYLQSVFTDYHCHKIYVEGTLHLKTIVSMVAENTICIGITPTCKKIKEQFLAITDKYKFIEVPDEAAANVIAANGNLIIREEYPESAKILRNINPNVLVVSNIELEKVDGSLTCCSVLF